jgi:2,3-bisphosphoglycerate-independent phosphoglycerate mutase
VALIILDGWGLRDERAGNAVALAATPTMDRLLGRFRHTRLQASGEAVGLPAGQMGNSEVGHLTLGAGRVVYQDLVRIGRAVADGTFFANPALAQAMDAVRAEGRALHLMGLLSDGGVHSHQEHLYALLRMAKARGLRAVFVHALTDGRDTPPRSAAEYLRGLLAVMGREGIGRLATVIGRYYAMDRDHRWPRTEQAWRAMARGEGRAAADPVAAVEASYAADVTDEFLEPIVVAEGGRPVGRLADGDALICFNFRADRVRQILEAIAAKTFDGFPRPAVPVVRLVCLTEYKEEWEYPVAFPPERLASTLGRVFEAHGIANLRIAETEKYPHVTYFLNGGEETPFGGEQRLLVPSPSVPTYDRKPEMSAYEVAERAARALRSRAFQAMILNFANPDMVGHTGSLPAAIAAVEAVDTCLGTVLRAVQDVGGVALVLADHGNAEVMIDPATGGPHTAHTTNPVPCLLVDPAFDGRLREGGALADVAPTLLGLLGLPAPAEMTGRDLRG